MKILPSYEMKIQQIESAIENCKELLGEEKVYSVKTLNEIREKYKNIIEYFINEANLSTTKLYKKVITISTGLNAIIKVMEINNIKEIKGFKFTNQQIEKCAKESNYF